MKTSYEEFEEMLSAIAPIGSLDHQFRKAEHMTDPQPFLEIADDVTVGNLTSSLFGIPRNEIFTPKYKVPFLCMLMFYRFYQSGKKKFKFSEDVMRLLQITDFSRIIGDSIRIPFPCVCMNMNGVTDLKLYGNPIKNIFATIYEKSEFSHEFVTRHGYNIEADRILFIMAYAKVGTSMKTGKDDMFYWVVPFRNDQNIVEIVKNRLEMGDIKDDMKDSFLHILTFAINLMLYMTSSKEMIEFVKPESKHLGSRNPRKVRRRAREEKETGHYVINDKVIIRLKDREAIVSSLAREERLSFRGKWIVRGHWRDQAHGPGFSLKKLIWIHPFFKGEDLADVINKEYEVK